MIAAHQRDDTAKDRSFDEATRDIAACDVFHCVADVEIAIEIERAGRNEITAIDANDVSDEHENGKRQNGGPETRRIEIAKRISGEGVKGVDLFGDFHRANFRGNACADPACEHKSCQNRPQFARNTEDDDVRYKLLGIEA